MQIKQEKMEHGSHLELENVKAKTTCIRGNDTKQVKLQLEKLNEQRKGSKRVIMLNFLFIYYYTICWIIKRVNKF